MGCQLNLTAGEEELIALAYSPTLELHSLRPHLDIGTSSVVVTVASFSSIGKVGALAASLSVCPAGCEVLCHPQCHDSLWVIHTQC